MLILDLNPNWVSAGGEGITRAGQPVPERAGIGVIFDCPCGACGLPCFVPFSNPLDGQPPNDPSRPMWEREGETFETLTLRPSILRSRAKGGCGWHGFVTAGVVTGQVENA